MIDAIAEDILTFYSEHPINEAQIMAALAARGPLPDRLSADDLYAFDQDHYGGIDATARLADAARISPGAAVLDLCSGMGGPARFLASRFGARVTGIDANDARVRGARRLSALVGLDGPTRFVHGNALALPFRDRVFDAVISQEAFLHIADKKTLFRGIVRVLRPSGRLAFTDWIAHPGLGPDDRERLAGTIMAKAIHTIPDYRDRLGDAGMAVESVTDLTAAWRVILRARHAMFSGLAAETVRQFGAARHRAYMEAYDFFLVSIESGKLGGARFTARAP